MDNGWIGNYSYFRARLSADSVAVVDVDTEKKYTYGDLDRRANILANLLRTRYGIEKGDRVAFLSRSRVELIDGYFATGKLGAILVPYNARLSPEELGRKRPRSGGDGRAGAVYLPGRRRRSPGPRRV